MSSPHEVLVCGPDGWTRVGVHPTKREAVQAEEFLLAKGLGTSSVRVQPVRIQSVRA